MLAGNTGPAALLAQLEGATEEAEELDGEEVRGVATRRFRVTVSTTAALEQAPAEVREQLRTYAEATGLPETYPMELWISDDGLVRRIRTVLDQESPAGGAGRWGGGGRGDRIAGRSIGPGASEPSGPRIGPEPRP